MASGTVNFVNAGLLAEQTGIQVCETIRGERRLPQLDAADRNGRARIGSSSSPVPSEHTHPRIVQIGDFPIVFVPEGRIAYVPHENVPGVIGRVGHDHGRIRRQHLRMVTSAAITTSAAIRS
jgi:D-3-phosphoglycerate dehydrogenase